MLKAHYVKGDGRIFEGPTMVSITEDGHDLIKVEAPAMPPGREDWDKVLEDLGYRPIEGSMWRHGVTGSVEVERIPQA